MTTRCRGRPSLRARRLRGLVAALLALGAATESVGAQELRYSGSIQYATGRYVFDARSHSVYLASRLTVGRGRVEAWGSAPVIFQNGGVVTTIGDRLVPSGGEGHGVMAHRRSGQRLPTHTDAHGAPGAVHPAPESSIRFSDSYRIRVGDPSVGAAVDLISGPGTLRVVQATAGAKIPATSLDSGVGTGRWDYGLGAAAAASLGRVLLLLDARYWWFGDLPDLDLRDGVSYAVSAGRSILSDRGSVIASLSGASRYMDAVNPPVSAGLAVGYRVRSAWYVNGGIFAGLSESAPDVAIVLGWAIRR